MTDPMLQDAHEIAIFLLNVLSNPSLALHFGHAYLNDHPGNPGDLLLEGSAAIPNAPEKQRSRIEAGRLRLPGNAAGTAPPVPQRGASGRTDPQAAACARNCRAALASGP